jgi:tetratricopeptide (TPR) repeat protein
MFRLLFAARRWLPEWMIRPVVAVAVAVPTGLFVPRHNLHWLELMFLPIIAFGEGIERSARFIAKVIARRNYLVFTTIAVALAIAILVGFISPFLRILDARTAFLFLLLGAVLGVLLRQYCGRLALATLFDRRVLEPYFYCLLIWAVILIVYPWTGHAACRPIYIAGLGIGLLIHKGARQRFVQIVVAYRRIQEVSDAFPPKGEFTFAEFEALKLLKRGRQLPSMRFRRLRARIEDWRAEDQMTKRIALISASVYRLEGEYDRSLDEIVSALAMPPRYGDSAEKELVVDAVLSTLYAINLLEVGREVDADRLLDELSVTTPDCPLACATRALRKAELVNIGSVGWELSEDGLNEILKALRLRRQAMLKRSAEHPTDLDSFITRFLDFGVPITNSFIGDINGYCHLAAGHFDEARRLLEQCIEREPSYSIALLHLGDYFLARSKKPRGA